MFFQDFPAKRLDFAERYRLEPAAAFKTQREPADARK